MSAARPSRLPVSTYRLQFSGQFRFPDAEAIVPYLERLGITECYASPLLAARPGSTHGYDIADHNRLNPELGGDEEFRKLRGSLSENGMGLILDFVPNHMGVDPSANLWWRDVLKNGPSAASARFFDIDWDPVVEVLKGKVLLPILGDQYGVELESGRLRLQYEDGEFSLQYYDYNLPLNPRPLNTLLAFDIDRLETDLGADAADLTELRSILFQLEHMPAYTESSPEAVEERHRESQVATRRLAELTRDSQRVRQHIEANVRTFNGQPNDSSSFDLLHELLEAQPYRLAFWRTASFEINYRRFFDINELAGLRTEDVEVFRATHALVLELVREGLVTGLRLDHIDGLFDPGGYLRRLQERCGVEGGAVYSVVEKILSTGEPLHNDWQAHGTTGYDFLNDLNGLFVDARNARKMRRLYERFTDRRESLADIVYECKKLIIATSLAGELTVLAHELDVVSEANRRTRDFTFDSLQEALREVVACFPIYRTYVGAEGGSEFDERTIETAVRQAIRRNPAMEPTIFEFIGRTLFPRQDEDGDSDEYRRQLQFAQRFQQYTGPVQAKGLEDTAFYRYAVLVSLNEVGGDPSRFGRSPVEFHAANAERLRQWPLSMLSTASHDHKRGEDVRARLNVLSEIPEEFRQELAAWARLNAGSRSIVDGQHAPDRNDEYVFYQSLIGTWPSAKVNEASSEYVERMERYMFKAIKEAKVHTSWINANDEYDTAVSEFVKKVLAGPRAAGFLERFVPFVERVARLGMLNSLSQVVLKIAAPGVPDYYQGCELWDYSLVDPDNRRPVDFGYRQRLIEQMEPWLSGEQTAEAVVEAVREMADHWEDGRIKLYLTSSGLRARRQQPDLFLEGEYVPLESTGEHRENVVAFARTHGGKALIAVVPRLVASLVGFSELREPGPEVWGDDVIRLPESLGGLRYRNVFTHEEVSAGGGGLPVGAVLRNCPVGLLLGE